MRGRIFLEREQGWSEFSDTYDFIDELVQQGLPFRLLVGSETRYRTRFAESLRLLARYASCSPSLEMQTDGRPHPLWLLIFGCYYVLENTQSDRPASEVVEACLEDSTKLSFSSLQKASLRLMLGVSEESEGWQLGGFQFRSTLRILQATQHVLPVSNNGKYATGSVVCAGTGVVRRQRFTFQHSRIW